MIPSSELPAFVKLREAEQLLSEVARSLDELKQSPMVGQVC